MIYHIIKLLDEGNRDVDCDKISWILMKIDENFELTRQIIQGLHEDLLEFEDKAR